MVAVCRDGEDAVLTVRDTGIGVPESELPRIFERFHRVEDARGRTHEGTGIGLALVQELVRLHGGTVEVQSALGEGTVFTVRLRFGTAHLPTDRIGGARTVASTATRADAFVEEALRWLSDVEQHPSVAGGGLPATEALDSTEAEQPRILLVDDNADMRDYVQRLLAARYAVETAADGQAALEAMEARRPDLVLADVMMPRLDGFGLVEEVRARPGLRDLPVVLLSARAGEESKVEGLEAGADDYLVKPFSARELVARVAANLDLARVRRQAADAVRESEARFRALVTASSYVIYRMSPDWTEMLEFKGRGFLSDTKGPSDGWLGEYIHPDDQPLVTATIQEAIRAKGMFELEHRVRRADGSLGWTLSRAVPLLDAAGEIVEWFGAASDVTVRRQAEEALRESEERFRQFAENSADALWILDAEAQRLQYLSPAFEAIWGEPRERVMAYLGRWAELVHPDDRGRAAEGMRKLRAGEVFTQEYRVVRPCDGAVRWIEDTGFPMRDADGRVRRVAGIAQDVTDRKGTEEAVRASRRRLRALVEGIPQLVWRAVDGGRWTWASPQWTGYTGLTDEASRGLGWLEALHPDDREAAIGAWREAEARGAFEVEYRVWHAAEGRHRWFQTRAAPVRDEDGRIVEWLGTSTDVDELRGLHERQRLLLAELQHRIRNTLGVVRSIARRTAARSATVDDCAMHLDGRLNAFARTQAMVTRDPGAGVDLESMVAEELLAHAAREGEQVRIEGPTVRFHAKAAETIGLAVHELATNAVKHGALSSPDGRIEVAWRVEEADGAGPRLRLSWTETGGPAPPTAPARRGFGAELLERTLAYELKAKTRLTFEPTGLRCTIDLPLTPRAAVATGRPA